VDWILVCKLRKFGEYICYNSRDIEFFLNRGTFLARPVISPLLTVMLIAYIIISITVACRCMQDFCRFKNTTPNSITILCTLMEGMALYGINADLRIRSRLRSASTSSLPVRRTRLSTVGDRVFTARYTLVQSAVLRSHVVCLSVCLSVRPSVTLVDCDYIGWNSSEITSLLVSLECSFSADPNIRGSTPRGTPGNLGPKWPPLVDLSVGDIRSQIAAEWLQIAQRSQWRACRETTIALLNGAIADSLQPPLPPNGVPYAPKIREWPYLRIGWSDTLHVWF